MNMLLMVRSTARREDLTSFGRTLSHHPSGSRTRAYDRLLRSYSRVKFSTCTASRSHAGKHKNSGHRRGSVSRSRARFAYLRDILSGYTYAALLSFVEDTYTLPHPVPAGWLRFCVECYVPTVEAIRVCNNFVGGLLHDRTA